MTRIRVVILGTGFGRTVQAPSFRRHPEFELVGISGASEEKTRRLAAELGIERWSADWRSLIADLRPDLVSVVTPVDLHYPMAIAALEGGSHLLSEKPTALNRHQAAAIRDRAAELGRVAAINHEFRFFPARQVALRLIGEGAIGTPRRLEIVGRYALWSTPGSRGMSWLSDRARGGGILGALGSHHTDCARTIFGEPESVVASVRVDQPWRGPTEQDPSRARATADDAFTLEYRFAGGSTALIDLDATAPYRWERFEIRGADATLRWDESGYRLWRIAPGRDAEEMLIPGDLALHPVDGEPALIAPFGVLLGRLHRAIRGEGAMSPNFDDAVAVQSALDAARQSSESGRRVRVMIPKAAALVA
ncbi:MAG TPA: Gfo/Idh/MocA family oxidoreductase [Candidatus Udaeobacter sp.]|jgi:predicted dehydrogenase|nr:Gfo/Idh/MocA family oxidoreductase [Candidatus Udaeobacter sp.]